MSSVYNYHQYQQYNPTSPSQPLVITHFPNPYPPPQPKQSKPKSKQNSESTTTTTSKPTIPAFNPQLLHFHQQNTRIVRIPRLTNTDIPQFSNLLPGEDSEDQVLNPDPHNIHHFKPRFSFRNQWFDTTSISPLSNYLTPEQFAKIVDEVNLYLRQMYEPRSWALLYMVMNSLSFGLINGLFDVDKVAFGKLERFIEDLNSRFDSGNFGNEKNCSEKDKDKIKGDSHGDDNDNDDRTIDGDHSKMISLKGVRLISPADNGFLSLDFEIPKPGPEIVVETDETVVEK
ncbi:unnamed protein product [Ambrosiozyma monospora]|uniref:Ras modification protein ERF4 n=1 Tax=Ambrosiozyma monospora TaxID=43982 RepID=A0A9W7DGB8_AMBMO|nr:unnamed protein product [Ambrosiozyma monospora]